MLDLDPLLPTALLDFPSPEAIQQAGSTANDPSLPRQRWRFDRPSWWLVAHDPSQVPSLLDAAHSFARQGQWCVGWVAYEAAPGLNPHLPVKALPPGQPYAVWAVFDHAEPWSGEPIGPEAATPWSTGAWQPDLDTAQTETRIAQIHDLIRAGEVYQINLTTQLHAPYEGEPASLWAYFMALRRSQPQGFSLMLDARAACRAPGALLSVSPELFFDWDGHVLTTRPMKGTAARGHDTASDEAAARHLKASPKERAENLMIVDLLRNDLSRIAKVGSVQVPSLFDVQALPTVWQMTSTVTARSKPGLTLSEAFAALFPCGSVTGAPKRQAMHHIATLERSARGVYCGAVGMMAPGGRVTFNVPIRTVCVHTPPPPAPWRAHCGIGSGITLDAQADGETAEWRAKQGFLKRADRPFQLLESLRLAEGHIPRLDLHLARITRSAAHFGWPCEDTTMARMRDALAQAARHHPEGIFKLRLLLDAAGHVEVQAAALTGPGSALAQDGPTGHDTPLVDLCLAEHPMADADEFIRHKTTRRDAYAGFPPQSGCFDTVLWNRQGEVTESTIANIAVKQGGRWFTPPASAGLLPGVMRQSLISAGVLQERAVSVSDLAASEGIALFNSVRGWLPARLITTSG